MLLATGVQHGIFYINKRILNDYTHNLVRMTKGFSQGFRSWSIKAFFMESIVIIFSFIGMVFILHWNVTETMAYFILGLMSVTAIAILIAMKPDHPY